MKRFRVFALTLLTLACVSVIARSQESAPERKPDDGPFLPQAELPGGRVLALYEPTSTLLRQARIHEAEKYNTATPKAERLLNVLNIHNPSIEVHLAEDRAKNGAAVIVAPGGGHKILWVGPEGYDLVPFFAKYGVSTIVLRNRLRVDGYEPTVDAANDAMQAVRLVRKHAQEWGLDENKIGIMGFSAGAELAAPAALFYEQFDKERASDTTLGGVSCRPDFVSLIYPGPTPFTKEPETKIPAKCPPSFLMCAGVDDRVHAVWADEYFSPMLKASVPNLEMHIYARGGHGGSIGPRNGIPMGTWPTRFMEWFEDLGFLGEPGVPTKAAKDVAAYAAKK